MNILKKVIDLINTCKIDEAKKQTEKKRTRAEELDDLAKHLGYPSFTVMEHEIECRSKAFKAEIRQALKDIRNINWEQL